MGANPGTNSEIIQALREFPNVRSRILIAGFIPDEDLATLYSGAQIFLFPSIAEGFGIPPLEAMQCGTPVIASNTTSIPEVVGDAGILLSPTDEDAWCQAMLTLARSHFLRQNLRQRSIARANLFSWKRFITETLKGYAVALDKQ